MARKIERINEDDVIVHITSKWGGCSLDKRTDEHLHTQVEHRAHVDQVGTEMRERRSSS